MFTPNLYEGRDLQVAKRKLKKKNRSRTAGAEGIDNTGNTENTENAENAENAENTKSAVGSTEHRVSGSQIKLNSVAQESWLAGWRRFYQEVNHEATGRIGAFEWGVVLVAALGLIVMQFGGQSHVFLMCVELFNLDVGQYWELANLCFWVGACSVGYFVIPVIYLKLCGESLADYYLGFKGLTRHIEIYLALLIPTSGIVFWVSYWPDFQNIYPFYRQAGRSWFDLLAWELAYGVQFFTLEFFFRSFLLQSLRRSMGFGAILLMLLPYCMIHFPKTAAESAGSIVAGVVLGMLAMRGRSIWGGVLIHWIIAIEMDVFSLAQKGALPPWAP